jgi:hypothetical protein
MSQRPMLPASMQARLTGSITTGGRGVVANTTYGFMAASVTAVLMAAPFAFTGHPYLAFVAMLIPYGAFFLYFFGTWHHVPKHPDISMTGDGDYVAALTQRIMAAKNMGIITDQAAMIGGTLPTAMTGSGDADA